MLYTKALDRLRTRARSTMFWIQAAVLLLAGILPIMVGQTSAAQLTSRSVLISASKINATNVQHSFTFTTANSQSVRGIIFQFCTAPLGTCTLPTGMAVQASTPVSQSGFPGSNVTAGVGAFQANVASTNTGNCTMNTNTYLACYNRSDATVATGSYALAITGITAPSTKQSVYIRIGLYSDTSFGANTDNGTVAEAFVDQLVVNGRVQERLDFCVAAIDSAAALPSTVSTCSAIGINTVDIGVVDNASIAVSPVVVTATNGSNNKYGILMSNTNAAGGESIQYFPEAALTGTNQLRNFRVAGSTCSATNTTLTDTCFYDAATTGTIFTAGSERFGMYVACIDNTVGTTTNLTVPNTSYTGTDGTTAFAAGCQTEAGNLKFAWDNSGSAVTLASSSAVVDSEIVKIRFGATASATTPTGSYTVTTNYVATPTF